MVRFWNSIWVWILSLMVFSPLTSFAWYVPCYCGCGEPIQYLDGDILDSTKVSLQNSQLSEYISAAKQSLEQLYALVKIYDQAKDIYNAIGSVRNAFENFSFENILNSWNIEDWNDFDYMANKFGHSSYSSLGNSDPSTAEKSANSFADYLYSVSNRIKEEGDILEDYSYEFSDGAREIAYMDDDYIMRAIITQEQRNAQIKAVTAAAARKADDKVASNIGISSTETIEPTINEAKTSQVVSGAATASVWSDMSNSFNLLTREKLNTQSTIIEKKAETLSTEYLDAF